MSSLVSAAASKALKRLQWPRSVRIVDLQRAAQKRMHAGVGVGVGVGVWGWVYGCYEERVCVFLCVCVCKCVCFCLYVCVCS